MGVFSSDVSDENTKQDDHTRNNEKILKKKK